jgi:hypothetical protein
MAPADRDTGPLAGTIRTVETDRRERLPDDAATELLEKKRPCMSCRVQRSPDELYIIPPGCRDGPDGSASTSDHLDSSHFPERVAETTVRWCSECLSPVDLPSGTRTG